MAAHHKFRMSATQANWPALKAWWEAWGHTIGDGVLSDEDDAASDLVMSANLTDDQLSVALGETVPTLEGYTSAEQATIRATMNFSCSFSRGNVSTQITDIAIWAPDKKTLETFANNRKLVIDGKIRDGVAYIRAADKIASGLLYFLRIYGDQAELIGGGKKIREYVKANASGTGDMAGVTYWELDGCRLFEKADVTAYLNSQGIEYQDWA